MAEEQHSRPKDRRLRVSGRVQKFTSVATIDAGVREVRVRYWGPHGQSSAISGRCGAGLPAREWSRADRGGMLGTSGGRTPLDNQGHAFVGELLRNQLFRPFRLSRRWIPSRVSTKNWPGLKAIREDHWRKRHDLNLSKTLGVMSGDKPRGFPICSSPL